jgi:hypothetical protein
MVSVAVNVFILKRLARSNFGQRSPSGGGSQMRTLRTPLASEP